MRNWKVILGLTIGTCGSLFANEDTAVTERVIPEQQLQKKEKAQPIKNTFGYVDLGVGPAPLPLPIFGLGIRTQRNANGFDANLQTSTVVYATQVKLNLLYLRYLKPDLDKQFYFGIGPGVSAIIRDTDRIIDKSIITVSPELVFGKQYRSDTKATRFFQTQISFPTYHSAEKIRDNGFNKKHIIWFPVVTFNYGWGF